jgi:PBSX family phage terminase large subunit
MVLSQTAPILPSRSEALFRFKPFSKRQRFILTWWMDNSKYNDMDGIIADGAIRSGKTMSMSLSFLMWAMYRFQRSNFAICGKSIGAVRRNVVNDLKRMARSRGYAVMDRRSENVLIVTRGSHVNYFYLFGARDERSQDFIQGITLAGVLFDEAALMPESFVNQATGRCSVEGAKHWFNCNPAGSRIHWFKARWINQCAKKRYVYLHFTMDDNLSLSERTKDRYRNMYSGVFFQRYIEGRWVLAEGVIYSMFNDNLIADDSALPTEQEIRDGKWVRYIAVDYGTRNACAFLDVYDDGYRSIVANEYYFNSRTEQRQKSDAQYADDLVEFAANGALPPRYVYIDPSAESFQVALRGSGLKIRDADNSVANGIRKVASLFTLGRLMIHKRCTNTLAEIGAYVWDDTAAERGEEKPIKENDHAMDALRYYVSTAIKERRLMADAR